MDSGYVQPVDFFGDGTRIPMIAVSRFSKGGHISQTYTDLYRSRLAGKIHRAELGLTPITARSRDNLPKPLMNKNPYVPHQFAGHRRLVDLFDFDN